MDVQQMRVALTNKYSAATVKKWSDAQVIAVYKRLQAKNEI